ASRGGDLEARERAAHVAGGRVRAGPGPGRALPRGRRPRQCRDRRGRAARAHRGAAAGHRDLLDRRGLARREGRGRHAGAGGGPLKPARIVVDAYSERWLERGFPWVYRKEVVQGGGRPGQLARVFGKDGRLLGTALLDDGWIAARVYRHGDGPLDRELVFERLDRAHALRQVVVPPATTAFRLVNGENDGLPGLRVDWWSHYAVLVLDAPAVEPLVGQVVEWLRERLDPRGVTLCYRPDPRDERDFS